MVVPTVPVPSTPNLIAPPPPVNGLGRRLRARNNPTASAYRTAVDELELLDWKRRVFALYAEIRAAPDPEAAWRRWREVRDELFRDHPQSPLPAERRAAFAGLPFFDYDPALRVLADVEPADDARLAIGSSGEEPMMFRHFATAHFDLDGGTRR